MTYSHPGPTYETAAAWPTSPPPTEPVELEYHQVLRGGRWGNHGWWRILAGLALALFATLLAQTVPVVVWTAALMVGGKTYDQVQDVATGKGDATPAFLAVVNVGWALTIPVIIGTVFLVHRLRPGWVASVVGKFRWRWFAVSLGLAFVALVLTVIVSALLPAQAGDGSEMSGQLNSFTAQTRNFALVVLFLTPLQAAGEEYAFRGYLTQAFGGLLAGAHPWVSRTVAVLVPATLFALAHGAQDPPVFVDRLSFGIVAGILVIATGGLEAGIAMHVLNNFLAFGFALAFGDMTSALNPTGGTWWSLPTTLTQAIAYTTLAILVSRRMGLATRTTPIVLAPPDPRV